MPMHLSHRSRFNLHKLRSKRLRNGENSTINFQILPTLRLRPSLLTSSVMIATFTLQLPIRTQNTPITHITLLDTTRRLGEGLECAFWDPEVLCEDGERGVDEPIVYIEGSSLGIEVAVVEDEEVFCSRGGESLDYVALTFGEEPDVTFVGAEDLVFSGVGDGAYED